MAFRILEEECISCAACEAVCPNEAISEGDEAFVINSDLCTECVGFYDEQQCAEVCPVDACVPDPEAVETQEQLRAKFSRLHPNETS